MARSKALIFKSLRLLISRMLAARLEKKRSIQISLRGKLEYAKMDLNMIRKEYFQHGVMLAKGFDLEDSYQGKELLESLRLIIRKVRQGEKQPYRPEVIMTLATAYSEKGSLLRMMNRFREAGESLAKSLAFINSLIEDHPDNIEYQTFRSQLFFQQGELVGCQGPAFNQEAKRLYLVSLRIDLLFDVNRSDIRLKNQLISDMIRATPRPF